MSAKTSCPKSLSGIAMGNRIGAYLSHRFSETGVWPSRPRPFVPAVMSLTLSLLFLGGAGTLRAHAQQAPAANNSEVDKVAPVEERPDPLKRRLSDSAERNRRK